MEAALLPSERGSPPPPALDRPRLLCLGGLAHLEPLRLPTAAELLLERAAGAGAAAGTDSAPKPAAEAALKTPRPGPARHCRYKLPEHPLQQVPGCSGYPRKQCSSAALQSSVGASTPGEPGTAIWKTCVRRRS